MFRTTSLVRGVVAAATFVAAGGAFAEGAFMPEVGVSYLTGKYVERGTNGGASDSLGLNVAFGYEADNGLGVRALFLADAQPFRGAFLNYDKSFDNFFGVEATGSMPLGTSLNLKGGLGIGRTNLDEGPTYGHQLITDGLLSVGLQWRAANHYAMEVRLDHLTASGVTSAGIQFQWPF